MSDATPVLILVEWVAEPVFHLMPRWSDGGHQSGRYRLPDGSSRVWHRERTACGRIFASWSWIEHEDGSTTADKPDRRDGMTLRRDHAEKFARLCERCAPADPRVPRWE